MSIPKISVALADDHPVLLKLLTHILEAEGLNVVATAANGRELIDAVKRLNPDVAVTDIAMPGLNGLEAMRELQSSGDRTKMVVYTAMPDPELAIEAFGYGAAGFVLKHSSSAELVTASRVAFSGQVYVTPRLGDVPENVIEAAKARAASGERPVSAR